MTPMSLQVPAVQHMAPTHVVAPQLGSLQPAASMQCQRPSLQPPPPPQHAPTLREAPQPQPPRHWPQQAKETVSPMEVAAGVESLYRDELKPYGRILRKRLAELAQASGRGSV